MAEVREERVFAVEQPRAGDRGVRWFNEERDMRWISIRDDADAIELERSLLRLSPGAVLAVQSFHQGTDNQKEIQRNHAHLERTQISLSRSIVYAANEIVLYLNHYFKTDKPLARDPMRQLSDHHIQMHSQVSRAFNERGNRNGLSYHELGDLQLTYNNSVRHGLVVRNKQQLAALASSIAAAIEHANSDVMVMATAVSEAHGEYVLPVINFRFVDAERPGTLAPSLLSRILPWS